MHKAGTGLASKTSATCEARQIGSDNLSKPAIGEWLRRQHEGQRRAMDATMDEIGRAGALDSARTPMIWEKSEGIGVGGYGSGNWYRWDKKDTVEDCRALDVNKLTRDKLLKAGRWVSGSLTWTNTRTGEQVSSLGFDADTREGSSGSLRLAYTLKRTGDQLDYLVPLTTTAVVPLIATELPKWSSASLSLVTSLTIC